jgi:adenylate cyclase
VKLIGDEVMFVAGDTVGGCRIALCLADTFDHHSSLPQVRTGLAAGEVIPQDGDYFGPVVNLASRIVKLGSPGTVLVPATVREEIGPGAGFVFESIGPQILKGFDEPVEVYAIKD